MTAKELLANCRNQVLTLRQLDVQLEHCLSAGAPAGVKVQRYDADPRGTNDPTAAAIQLYDGLMEHRETMQQHLAQISGRAWTTISTVKDVRTLAILNGYYLQGQTDQEIAQVQGLSREHVNRLRHEALKSLQ